MKEVIAYVTFWCLCILVGINASSTRNLQKREVDANELENRQKNLNQLLVRVHRPNTNAEQSTIAAQWDIEAQAEHYTYADAVKHFLVTWKAKEQVLLPRGKVFTLLNDEQVEQAVAVFDLLYFAKDFDTFYKTACWARDNINEGVFVYSLYVAVFHRNDTQHMTLPPISEVLPYFFVDAKTIQKAQDAGTEDSLVFPRTDSTTSTHDARLASFTGDLGLNEFYATFLQRSPMWMTERTHGKSIHRQGELFYYIHKQLLARYNLQRIAAGLPLTQPLRLGTPIANGYFSHLRYPDGAEMPSRPDDYKVQSWADSKVLDYERRIRDAIDIGYVTTKNGSQIPLYNKGGSELFGTVVAGGLSSPNLLFYGWVVRGWRSLLSRTADPRGRLGLAPGVTAHDTTVLRDPAFFQALARIADIFGQFEDRFMRIITPELDFPGVRVESVHVDELETVMEDVDVALDNGLVGVSSGARARLQRLTHRPFGLNVTVHSEIESPAMLRIFLGPKTDADGNSMPINDLRNLMVEMDRVPVQLTTGQNVIRRESRDSTFGKTESGPTQRSVEVDKLCGFPLRLLLPKVHRNSMPFQLFVMVTPHEGPMEVPHAFASCGAGFNNKYPDAYPMGYPFHYPVNEWDFYTPNMHFKDVIISHRTETAKRM